MSVPHTTHSMCVMCGGRVNVGSGSGLRHRRSIQSSACLTARMSAPPAIESPLAKLKPTAYISSGIIFRVS